MRYLAIGLAALLAISCEPDTNRETNTETGSPADSRDSTDGEETEDDSVGDTAKHDSEHDVRDTREETGGPPTREPRCPEPTSDNTSPYVCDDDCGTVVDEPSDDYEIPDLPPSQGARTLEEMREELGGNLPSGAHVLHAEKGLVTSEDHHEVHAEPEQSITFHFAAIHDRSESVEGATLELSILVNYRPVIARYESYSPDRSEVLEATEDVAATTIPVSGKVELVDVTIPASAFETDGRYDIAMRYNLDGIQFADGHTVTRLYYGGDGGPEHRCARRGDIHEMNQHELDIVNKYRTNGYVYPGGKYKNRDVFEEIPVDPGETVAVDYSIGPWSNVAKTAAVVPFVNDRPRGKRMIAHMPPDRDGLVTGFRDRFVLEMPEQPGVYLVELGIWNLPYLEVGEEPGWDMPEVLGWNGKSTGTNGVYFKVTE